MAKKVVGWFWRSRMLAKSERWVGPYDKIENILRDLDMDEVDPDDDLVQIEYREAVPHGMIA